MVTALDRPTSAHLVGYSAEHPHLLLTEFPPEMAECGAVNLQSLLGPAELEKIVWLTAPYRL